MKFNSTRNKNNVANGPEAIVRGIAEDGGLYVPAEFENLSHIIGQNHSYEQTLEIILKSYFPELDLSAEIKQIYQKYSIENRVNYRKVQDKYIMELFHGPTCAFKDFALQVLPLLMKKSKEYLGEKSRTLILTATSGDTGKAALEGFANQDAIDTGIDIAVLYPKNGVSQIQKKQMTSQEGKNVLVLAVEGDFDDAQNLVKEAFLDQDLAAELAQMDIKLSSANSINIGRLVPQIAYYFYTYNQMLKDGEITAGEKLSFCVPTGNFGDILAGYYAKKMGLPVDKLITASNENKVLKEFMETGTYDRNRALILTSSPSMDIIISSNLERLLYHTSNDAITKAYMEALKEEGSYTIGTTHQKLLENEGFLGGYSKKETAASYIAEVYQEAGYLLDPHTAVAWKVAQEQDLDSKIVVLSTASPYKFTTTVCDALDIAYENEHQAIKKLEETTGLPVPLPIQEVLGKETLHTKIIEKEDFIPVLKDWVKNGKLQITVPATTANIGPGFDTLGIALDLYANFDIEYTDIRAGRKIEETIFLFDDAIEEKYRNADNLFIKSYLQAAKQIGAKRQPGQIKISIHSAIPISRGLGSSASFIVAGVTLAYELSGQAYNKDQILQIANAIEGHPDNVAPAIYGGFRASMADQGQAYSLGLEIHNDLNFIALVPASELSTEESRRALPDQIDHKKAVQNVSSTALLIGCFYNRDYRLLKLALRDNLHQPYRLPLIKEQEEILQIADQAVGVYLSGAGSTIMILDDKRSGKDYKKQLKDENISIYDLKVCFSGTKVVNIINK